VFEPLQLAPGYLLKNAWRDGEAFASALGAKTINDLRALPVEAILEAGGGRVSHPVIGPGVLPQSPYDAYVAGTQNAVPILIGSNAEEARSLTDVSQVTAATFEAGLTRTFGPLPPALLSAYPYGSDSEAKTARLDFERDLRFGWDMWAWARLQAQGADKPVYYYVFSHKPPFPAGSPYAGWGASHFAELWYMFDHLKAEPWAWTREDLALAGAMSDYWVNFIKTGNPNAPGLVHWPMYKGLDADVQILDYPIRTGGVHSLKGLKVFDATYSGLRSTR
jgi:para-nitrobenzyl esterase